MTEPRVILEEYLTSEGRSPFRDWLHSLKDRQARARIRVQLARLALGNWGDIKPVGQGVSELRINYGPGYRIYLAARDSTWVLLLGGGTKKRQQTDIRKAHDCWNDYQRR